MAVESEVVLVRSFRFILICLVYVEVVEKELMSAVFKYLVVKTIIHRFVYEICSIEENLLLLLLVRIRYCSIYAFTHLFSNFSDTFIQ